jgi:hypothetical protein
MGKQGKLRFGKQPGMIVPTERAKWDLRTFNLMFTAAKAM